MNVLFIPTLGLDVSLLDRLAGSVDYRIKYKVIFNNGPTGALETFRSNYPDWIIKETDTANLGVAGSWNACAEMFPEEPSYLIMNDDAYFLPGYLQIICDTADRYDHQPIIHLNSSNAYYCFVWTKVGVETFGTFDENFWPAYYEDCDMRVRHRLKNYNGYVYALEGRQPLPHGKPRTGGVDYNAMLQGCGLLNRAYWKRKWGNRNFDYRLTESVGYETPYKDHRLLPHEWVWMPEERAKRYPLYETFMSLNPSLYD